VEMIFVSLAVCLLVGLLLFLPALFCNWIFRLWLRRLEVPASFILECKRERLMTLLVFMCSPIFIGQIFILFSYAIGIFRHFRDKNFGTKINQLPYIPQIALGELIAMVFSLALFPLLAERVLELASVAFKAPVSADAVGPSEMAPVIVYVFGVLIFPMCFASAYLRLDSNRVPYGWTRTIFLALYPYLLFTVGVAFLCVLAFAMSFFFSAEMPYMRPIFSLVLIVLGFALLGSLVTNLAKREALLAAALKESPQ